MMPGILVPLNKLDSTPTPVAQVSTCAPSRKNYQTRALVDRAKRLTEIVVSGRHIQLLV
jgi:hypothetical protein